MIIPELRLRGGEGSGNEIGACSGGLPQSCSQSLPGQQYRSNGISIFLSGPMYVQLSIIIPF